MGCDIHIMVEKKNGGKWQVVSGTNPDIARNLHYAELYKNRGEAERAQECLKRVADCESGESLKRSITKLDKQYPETERQGNDELQREYESELAYEINNNSPKVFRDWIYDGRNYDLFAILADVRNGRGFAGIKTGEGFVPISEPRGVPEDASPECKDWVKQWDGDGHSHSFHTVRQLIEFPYWENGTVKYGVVDENEYKEFKKNGQPNSYCGDVSGRDIIHISNESMDAMIKGQAIKQDGKNYYTRVQWQEEYKSVAGSFFAESIPKLKELAGDDLDSVRIVFFFDN